ALIGDVEHVTANTQFDAVAGIPLLLQRNVELSEILIVKIVGAPNGVVATARVETIVAVGPAIAGCAFERQLRRRRHAPEIDDAGANETMARDSDRADEPRLFQVRIVENILEDVRAAVVLGFTVGIGKAHAPWGITGVRLLQ